MHIVEPTEEICSPFHNHTRSGGILSRDFTEGYGPIEYVIKRAPKGEYIVKVRLFSKPAQIDKLK